MYTKYGEIESTFFVCEKTLKNIPTESRFIKVAESRSTKKKKITMKIQGFLEITFM